ncbi:hypothetical protein M231_04246 [Tremella mesenterica]|uniref:Uncharacterized protein n=1 Tax=Tremella mesenterica TaxID=5217 RepID=A0A4Q1BL22_TREME|nr:hypothetical protein M231_04246 [Tremella mesenterica]
MYHSSTHHLPTPPTSHPTSPTSQPLSRLASSSFTSSDLDSDAPSPTSSEDVPESSDDNVNLDNSEKNEVTDLPNFDGPWTPPVSPKPTRTQPLPSSGRLESTNPTQHPHNVTQHPYSRPNIPRRSSQRAFLPMTPLHTNTALPLGQGILPKSQGLARAVLRNEVPHAGMGQKGLGKKDKIIVPTKAFRTTFELELTASEFARR